jgi:alpha-glucuronidase
MFVDEVEKRSRVRLSVIHQLPNAGKGIIFGQRKELIKAFPSLSETLGTAGNEKAEGYRIVTADPGLIIVAGNDARGVLYGAGKLLRIMNYRRDSLFISGKIDISSAPRYALRGIS